jgi:DNA-binding beta-propeller fold protein YncE
MAETWLRDLLERAAGDGPPTSPAATARNALRAGVRLRRRRRAQCAAAGAAVVVVTCAAAVAVTGQDGNRAATPAREAGTVYVLGDQWNSTVTPVPALTNRPGKPIVVGAYRQLGQPLATQVAVTPGSKTIWVLHGGDTVTPVSTATHRAGKPVRVVKAGEVTEQVLAAPDGKTVYVLDSAGAVTPVSTATHRAGRAVEVEQGFAWGAQMAITPDGATLYVAELRQFGTSPSYVTPIDTAADRAGKRIRVATDAAAIAVAPDGKTVYIIGQPLTALKNFQPASQRIEVTAIATATNRPGKPVLAGKGSLGEHGPVAMTPDGQTLYISDNIPNGVIPFSTATNTPGKLIGSGSARVNGITITPDGRTAYVISEPEGNEGGGPVCTGPQGVVTPIATATNTAGKPVKVGCIPLAAAVTPDGRTIYVACDSGTVTPIATATGRPGTPIKVDDPVAIVIAP